MHGHALFRPLWRLKRPFWENKTSVTGIFLGPRPTLFVLGQTVILTDPFVSYAKPSAGHAPGPNWSKWRFQARGSYSTPWMRPSLAPGQWSALRLMDRRWCVVPCFPFSIAVKTTHQYHNIYQYKCKPTINDNHWLSRLQPNVCGLRSPGKLPKEWHAQ